MTLSTFLDRTLQRLGLVRNSRIRSAAFQAAQMSRLNADWKSSLIAADEEIRSSLTAMRGRSRQLYKNNDYAKRIVHLLRQNVVGPSGIALQATVSMDQDALADQTNIQIERAWRLWCKQATVDGRMSYRAALELAVTLLAVDGEVFIRKVKGYPHNPFNFALEFIDADLIDVNLHRRQASNGTNEPNEIRMGIEVDQWRRPVAYWVLDRHPSEGGSKRTRIPAEEVIHAFIPFMANQTRGVPLLHTAMTRLNMLGGYEEAELVASRVAASMMGMFTSKVGEDHPGLQKTDKGGKEIPVEPGRFEYLPEGWGLEMFNPQHPNTAYPEFTSRMLHGAAAGANVAYASMTGDLREVNFSSIRTGLLDERDGYRCLQWFVVESVCEELYEDWIDMAMLTGQLKVPIAPADDQERYYNAVQWQPRGWAWVDPEKDVTASILGLRSGLTTMAEVAAQQGRDWKDVLKQRKAEQDEVERLGVEIVLAPANTGGGQNTNAGQGAQNNGNSGN